MRGSVGPCGRPAVRQRLIADDWAERDAAIAAGRDPRMGHEPEEAYRALLRKISMTAEVTIGFG